MVNTRKTIALLLVLLSLISLVMLQSSTVKAQTRTLTVPDQYPTISDAIGNATDGETIFVRSGIYQEQQITIDKRVSLIGENESSTKIELNPPWVVTSYPDNLVEQSHFADCVHITAENVSISGFTISSKNGCFVSWGARTQLSNDNITVPVSDFFGDRLEINRCIMPGSISVQGGSSVLSENLLYGVWVDGANLLIEDNVFYNGAGINMWSTGCMVFRNMIVNCTDGVAFNSGSYNATVYYNDFINNSYTVIYDPPREHIPWYNQWDNGTVGNYWDYYVAMYPNASEVDHTGIGDTPYRIDANNIDNFPLMAPINISSPFSNSLVLDAFLIPPNRVPRATPTPNPIPQLTSTPTQNSPNNTSSSNPSSTPELSWLAIVPLFLSLFAIAVVVRHRRTANK